MAVTIPDLTRATAVLTGTLPLGYLVLYLTGHATMDYAGLVLVVMGLGAAVAATRLWITPTLEVRILAGAIALATAVATGLDASVGLPGTRGGSAYPLGMVLLAVSLAVPGLLLVDAARPRAGVAAGPYPR